MLARQTHYRKTRVIAAAVKLVVNARVLEPGGDAVLSEVLPRYVVPAPPADAREFFVPPEMMLELARAHSHKRIALRVELCRARGLPFPIVSGHNS